MTSLQNFLVSFSIAHFYTNTFDEQVIKDMHRKNDKTTRTLRSTKEEL